MGLGPGLLLVAAALLSAGVIRIVETSTRPELTRSPTGPEPGLVFDEDWLAYDPAFFRDRLEAVRGAQLDSGAPELPPGPESLEAVIRAVVPREIFEAGDAQGLGTRERRAPAPTGHVPSTSGIRPIPEPRSALLVAGGLSWLAARRWRSAAT